MAIIASEREPAVAGAFYPDDAEALRRLVDECLDNRVRPLPATKAIIAPHAGLVWSGAVAGAIYSAIRPLADRIRRVVVLGPAHRRAFSGIAAHSAAAWRTPLGSVAVDGEAVSALTTVDGVAIRDEPHLGEHSIELQLPFVQTVFPGARIVPLLVGDAAPEGVERALAAVWGGPETLIVVSSDLSHFHTRERAGVIDHLTVGAIEAGEWEGLDGGQACGVRAIQGLIRRAAALDLRITARDLRTSAEAGGGDDRVVGYGAFSFEDAEGARLDDDERRELLALARAALVAAVEGRPRPTVNPLAHPPALRAIRRTFTTLEIEGALRGCVGSIVARRSLVEDVAANVRESALGDPRFPPMTAAEAERTRISVSILGHERPIDFVDESDLLRSLRPGIDGLILRDGTAGALFLPSVWKTLPDPRDFLSRLKRKAGWDPERRRPTMIARRFSAEIFDDSVSRV